VERIKQHHKGQGQNREKTQPQDVETGRRALLAVEASCSAVAEGALGANLALEALLALALRFIARFETLAGVEVETLHEIVSAVRAAPIAGLGANVGAAQAVGFLFGAGFAPEGTRLQVKRVPVFFGTSLTLASFRESLALDALPQRDGEVKGDLYCT